MDLGCLSETVLLFFFRGRTGESGLVVLSEEIGLCVVFLSLELLS